MNEVSGFIEELSKIKDDALNNHDGWFNYSDQVTYMILIGIKITQKFDFPIDRNNLTTENLSKEIPNLFLQKIKRVSYCLYEKLLTIQE